MRRSFITSTPRTARIAWRLLMPAAVCAVAMALPAPAEAGSPALAGRPASSTGFGRATEIKAPANAAADPDAILIGVACTGRGDCSAGGEYNDADGNSLAMAVTEAHGRWAKAVPIQLPADVAATPNAEINGVACASAGNCVAVGYYQAKAGYDQGFIVQQTRGTWGRARQATPPANAAAGPAELLAVACTGTGACEAAGTYADHARHYQGMVITEAHGRWDRGKEILMPPGAAADPAANLTGISCVRAGDCVAGGFYYLSDSSETDYVAMGVVEVHGRWGRATRLRLPANAARYESGLGSESCVASGACLGAGGYATASSDFGLADSESGGHWGKAAAILARPAHAVGAELDGVSCVTARLCVGAGGYSTAAATSLAYLVTLSAGRWKDAGEVNLPANADVSTPRSFFYAVGCASDGYCAAVGGYFDKTAQLIAMAATRP